FMAATSRRTACPRVETRSPETASGGSSRMAASDMLRAARCISCARFTSCANPQNMATGKATPATTPRPAGEVKKSLVACMLEKTSGLMALLSATPPAAQSTLIAVVVQNSFDEFSVTRRGAAIIVFSLRESSFAGVKVEEATLAVVATDGAETGLLTGSGVGAADFEVLAGLCCTLATACATGPAAFTTGGTGGAAGVAITEA